MMAAPKRKDIHLSLEELLTLIPDPVRDPLCFGCSLDPDEEDMGTAGADCTSLANHFQLPLTREMALALISAWRHGFRSGAHAGSEQAVARGFSITPAEREHGGH